MKKLLVFLFLLLIVSVASYVWLSSEGSPEHADQTSVTIELPVKGQP